MNNQTNSCKIPTMRLFLDAFRAFETELAENLASKGFSDITAGNFNVLRHLNPEGMRLTELARDAQISKQAIGKMIKEVETKGYVTLKPDASDGRAKHICFTNKGKKLIELATNVVIDMENQYQTLLGEKNYNATRLAATQISQWHLDKEKD